MDASPTRGDVADTYRAYTKRFIKIAALGYSRQHGLGAIMSASEPGVVQPGFHLEAEVGRLRQLRFAYQQRVAVAQRSSSSVSHETRDVRALEALQSSLTEEGRWVAGPSTLYGVLGLTGRELERCRVLQWALDPLGSHALGTRVLGRFLREVRIDGQVLQASDLSLTDVLLEQVRPNSRADLVLVGDRWTVVVEAKVHASEQPQQGERLVADWPGATYVFLTVRGRAMQTTGLAAWERLSWSAVHDHITEALMDAGPAPTSSSATARAGLRDYLIAVRHLEHHEL